MNNEILNVLLCDRTTGRNILWANGEFGAQEIQAAQVDSIVPRYEKARAHQKQRTRDRAEIFTPPDICKLQNEVIAPPTDERRWQDFVDAKFLEITCGEAPYLVSRYNAVTGDAIPLDERIGLLDRKLNVVSNHTDNAYIKTKFCRVMPGILKVTQDNKSATWAKVPLQDFTSESDIDWSLSVDAIDAQLYNKYGLTAAERDFIESHVKAMT